MFYNNKKVLVTGGTGFVGSHFVQALLTAGAHVRIPLHNRHPRPEFAPHIELIPADMTNLKDCLHLCEGVDYIFHAAGAVAAANMTVNNPMSAISANLILTVRLLEAAMATPVQRILLFSSGTTAYPLVNHPIREEEMWDAPPAPVYFGYGWMRRYLELLGQFVASKSKIGVALCRPTAVFGRHDDFDPLTGHVVPALIRRAVAQENPFVVWGNGLEARDFLHVSDLVEGCLRLLEKHAVCDPVNIGRGQTHTIREVVSIILRHAGHTQAEVIFDETKPTTIPLRSVDTTKAKQLLDFTPKLSLEEGLADTVTWYRQQSNQ
ncbi:MAG: NAD(P)-dependent oxidoreductase [Magnetococcales bacterium]|nr:NAD(P)-dependent oxidoreductase [Magnetococcales bacterium]